MKTSDLMPKDRAYMADMDKIVELLPHFRSHGVCIRWSVVYKDTLVASDSSLCASAYVTWEQVAYLADHGVRMSVFGFARENLTKRKEGDDNG